MKPTRITGIVLTTLFAASWFVWWYLFYYVWGAEWLIMCRWVVGIAVGGLCNVLMWLILVAISISNNSLKRIEHVIKVLQRI